MNDHMGAYGDKPMVINTDNGRGGWVIAIVQLVIVIGGLLVFYNGEFGGSSQKLEVEITIPKVN